MDIQPFYVRRLHPLLLDGSRAALGRITISGICNSPNYSMIFTMYIYCICMYIYILYMYVCVYIYIVNIFIYLFIYIYTHTHTHTHKYKFGRGPYNKTWRAAGWVLMLQMVNKHDSSVWNNCKYQDCETDGCSVRHCSYSQNLCLWKLCPETDHWIVAVLVSLIVYIEAPEGNRPS